MLPHMAHTDHYPVKWGLDRRENTFQGGGALPPFFFFLGGGGVGHFTPCYRGRGLYPTRDTMLKYLIYL